MPRVAIKRSPALPIEPSNTFDETYTLNTHALSTTVNNGKKIRALARFLRLIELLRISLNSSVKSPTSRQSTRSRNGAPRVRGQPLPSTSSSMNLKIPHSTERRIYWHILMVGTNHLEVADVDLDWMGLGGRDLDGWD